MKLTVRPKTMQCANCDKTIVLGMNHPIIPNVTLDYHLYEESHACRADDDSLLRDENGFFLVANRGEEYD